MCKMCGLTQEADGESDPYQSHCTVHACRGEIPEGKQCSSCAAWGERTFHWCARAVTTEELEGLKPYRHQECGTVLSHEHRVPWPVKPEP